MFGSDHTSEGPHKRPSVERVVVRKDSAVLKPDRFRWLGLRTPKGNMKWIAIIALFLAVLARTIWWHSPYDLAIRISSTTHRGYSVSSIAFWLLLVIAIAFFALTYFRKSS